MVPTPAINASAMPTRAFASRDSDIGGYEVNEYPKMLAAATKFVDAPVRRVVDEPLGITRITSFADGIIPLDPTLLACIITEYVGEQDEEGR